MSRACREGRADLGRLHREQRVQPAPHVRGMSKIVRGMSKIARGMCAARGGKRKEESMCASVMRESRERVERAERMGRVEPSDHTLTWQMASYF